MNDSNKIEKTRNIITVLVIVISAICCIVPFFTNELLNQKSMVSAFGETIDLYGKGIYARNSFSMAIQALAQDMVTLILALPCAVVALIFVKKKSLLGQFALTGLLAYLLYTYMSYSFLMYYNDLFLLYVADMALSFYGFVISIMILMKNDQIDKLASNMKTRGLVIFLNITGVLILLMWLSRIIPTIGKEVAPLGLDNYSTLGIQVLDLGVIVPACYVISSLLRNKNKLGYVLGPVIIIKAVTLVIAVLAMAFYMNAFGVEVSSTEVIVFVVICLMAFFFLYSIMKQIKDITK